MTTAIDSNILVALWDANDALYPQARAALDACYAEGNLAVPAPVFAELMPGRTEAFLDKFFSDTGILVDWSLGEGVWRRAGRAYREYVVRRRRHSDPGPRHILTDFLIGAYAAHNGYQLLTLDLGLYRAAFPNLKIVVA